MISQDLLNSGKLSATDQKLFEEIATRPLLWAEAVFPPKIVLDRYTDELGIVHEEKRVAEGWLTRPWQMVVLESPGIKKSVRVSRRAGKAQSLDSIVYTPTGPKLMGELQEGDAVLTPTGGTTTITGVFPQGLKDIYEFTFNDGSKVEACLDHLWKITTTDWKTCSRDHHQSISDERIHDTRWIVENLPKYKAWGQALSVYATQAVAFDKQEVFIDPYIMGSILGDGHITAEDQLNLSLGRPQSLAMVGTSIDTGYQLKQHGESCDYYVTSKTPLTGFRGGKNRSGVALNKYTKAMRNYGLTDNLSYTKHIPKEYLYNSVPNRVALLQGLMDTDGTIDKIGRLTYYTTSKELSENVSWLVRSLGGTSFTTFKNSTHIYKSEKKQRGLCYCLQIIFPDDIVPFRLPSKLEKLKKRDIKVKRDIVSVELVAKKPAQCISVADENHMYLTDGFIPTHNTLMASVKCLHTAFVLGRGVLVFAPTERQVAEIYQTMHDQFMKPHPELFNDGTVVTDKTNPYVIRFSNGGFINFITAGTKSGGKGDAARGQGRGVKLIYMDEADYLSDADIEAILAIQIQDPAMEVILTSTPTGRRGKFYSFCTSPPRGWTTFHFTCWEAIPGFNEERAEPLRKQYTHDGFMREFEAEFGEEATGVFDKGAIERAMLRGKESGFYPHSTAIAKYGPNKASKYPFYGYATSMPKNPKTRRVIGVDWDKYGAGTQLLVLEAELIDNGQDAYEKAFGQPFTYMRIIHRTEIPKSQFTLTLAVKELVALNAKFDPDYYYMDAGYGEHQIETMQVLGFETKDPSDPAYGLHKKVRRINFSQGVEVIDPITKVPEKRRIKPEMVNRLVNKFDADEIMFSPYDDELQKQLENYVVEKITVSGEPKYTSENEHILDALSLACWGMYQEFGAKFIANFNKAYLDAPIGNTYRKIEQAISDRNDLLSNIDLTDKDKLQEEVDMMRSGYIRPENISSAPGVPDGLARKESSSFFHRGGRGWSGRGKF